MLKFPNGEDLPNGNQKENHIPVDFIDDGDRYVIYADVCGVAKDKIDIEVKGQVLMIHAEREFEVKSGFHSSEIKTGKLFKVIELKPDAGIKKIVAEYNYGLLKITIPKIKDKNSFKVEIQ